MWGAWRTDLTLVMESLVPELNWWKEDDFKIIPDYPTILLNNCRMFKPFHSGLYIWKLVV